MTMAAEKKEEKVEKRKALGRGLASLLPGPRAVTSTEVRVPGGETRVPRFARDDSANTVRDDSGSTVRDDNANAVRDDE